NSASPAGSRCQRSVAASACSASRSMPANSGSVARRSARRRCSGTSRLRQNGLMQALSRPSAPRAESGGGTRLELRDGRRHLGRMTTDNPLLDTDALPDFAAIRPVQINPAIDRLLAGYREAVATICAPATPRDFVHVIAPLEDWSDRLSGAFAPASHLHGVADSPELREAYNAAIEKLTEHATELGQNRELFAAVKAVADSDEFHALDAAQRTLVEDRLRDFRLSGVALEEPARSRFKAIQTELSKLQTGFEEAVLDATEAWTRPLSESELAGLPEQARRMLRQSAEAAGEQGWQASLKPPVVQAILTYADDRALRAEVYRAYNTRASDQGPHGGQFDNGPRIERIMALRHESATLLGFANAAELSLADK